VIPARVWPSRAMSLRYIRKALNTHETRMKTAHPYQLVSCGVSRFDFTR
jgi:hypothetical protein